MVIYTQKNTAEQDDDLLITIEELCERLMISETTAYKLLRSKKIAAFKIGCNWKIPNSSVKAYIQQEIRHSMEK